MSTVETEQEDAVALTEEVSEAIDLAVARVVARNLAGITKAMYVIAGLMVVIVGGGSAWVTRVDLQLGIVIEQLKQKPPPWLIEKIDKIEEVNDQQQGQLNRLIEGHDHD